jgi:hypothetical protein
MNGKVPVARYDTDHNIKRDIIEYGCIDIGRLSRVVAIEARGRRGYAVLTGIAYDGDLDQWSDPNIIYGELAHAQADARRHVRSVLTAAAEVNGALYDREVGR